MKFPAYILLILAILFPGAARCDGGDLNYSRFSSIPILHEGRYKPLDTFARITLQKFHGAQSLDGFSAEAWLAESLFDPARAMQRNLFKVKSPPVLQTLGLPNRKNNLYSFDELAAAFDKNLASLPNLTGKQEKDLTSYERDLLAVFTNIGEFMQITRAFSLLMPLKLDMPEYFAESGVDQSFLTLQKIEPDLKKRVTATIKKKGSYVSKYSEDEKKAALLAMQLDKIRTSGQNNTLFKVIPSSWDKNVWLAPWELHNSGSGSPESGALLSLWQSLALAYEAKDANEWNKISDEILTRVTSTSEVASAWKLKLETTYNTLGLIPKITVAYALAFILVVASNFFITKTLHKAASILLLTSSAAHIFLIAARVIILERPPVGTLYESILFVSLISAVTGLILSRRHKLYGLGIGSLTGSVLLATSYAHASSQDSMMMLVAVLDTDFWLATHVLCITAGYGLCIITGTLAHIYLFRATRRSSEKIHNPEKLMQTLALISLLLTALGTILGGIWADQSWGRFWGWDPKENGALMIVLWLIWLLHGKVGGHLKKMSFAAGLAFTNVVVAVSWFGVNLLGVGLHSYGFTDSASLGLIAFCSAESLIILTLFIKTRLQAAKP